MRGLSSTDFLNLWERGLRLHPLDRGLLLALSSGVQGTASDNPADWPLGKRNKALAELRSMCFGPRLEAWTACAQCGEKLEFGMDLNALTAEAPTSAPVEIEGKLFRLPTSRDLARVSGETNPQRAAVTILNACRLDADGAGHPWTDRELEAAGERLALADPLAETRLQFECPACGSRWDENLDITSFLWTEVEARARKLLLEVHTLASAYGWSEPEILALSETRRAFYLEVAHA